MACSKHQPKFNGNFKFEVAKKDLDKRCKIHVACQVVIQEKCPFFEVFHIKYYENAVLSFENTKIYEKGSIFFQKRYFLLYLVVFVNKALEKVYSEKLRG